jgi:anti-sigma factor RsiW
MTCREFIDFLIEYCSGALNEEEQRIFEAHLAECPWCVAYLNNYRETIKLGRVVMSTYQETTSEDMPEELVAAILAVRIQKA